MSLADWVAVRMEQIFFEAQLVANKQLDEIEEEVMRIMDLEGAQKSEDEGSKASILSREVKVAELDAAPEAEDILEAEGM